MTIRELIEVAGGLWNAIPAIVAAIADDVGMIVLIVVIIALINDARKRGAKI